MTFTMLGLGVDSTQVVQATPALERMAAASAHAEAAAESLGAASKREATGTAAATTATKMHTAALQAQAAASRMVANDSRMLAFQLNDIGVSLASGMSPGLVLVQQGAQIAQLGLRNVGTAAMSLARSFAPALAVFAAFGVGVAAMTTEINRNQSQQVEWTDVIVASWQLASERILAVFQPVLDTIGGWWDTVSPCVASGINSLIGAFDIALADVKTIWGGLPAALGDLAFQGAQKVIDGVIWMLRQAVANINGFINNINAMLPEQLRMGTLGAPHDVIRDLDVVNPFAGKQTDFEKELAQNRQDRYGKDYLGLIGDRAGQVAAAGGLDDENGKKTKDAARGVRSITDEFENLQQKVMGVREIATGIFSDMGTTLAQAFSKGGNVAMNVLESIVAKIGNVGEQLVNSSLNQLLNMGLNALTGALTGSMSGFSYGPKVFSDPWAGMRFANGGDFTVGGSGGVDSQMVKFMATPGEKVSVRTPQQMSHGSASGASININVDARGATTDAIGYLREWSRLELPGLVRDAVSDPYAVG